MTRLGPRLLAALVVLLVGIAGVALGVTLDRTMFRASRALSFLAGGRLPPPKVHARRDLLARLDSKLDLTHAQRVRADSVLARREAEIRALMEANRPRFEAIAARTREELNAILTPEQQVKFKELGKN